MTPREDPAAIRDEREAGTLRRILVLRAARVGDTLHVRPALELLRRALPAAQLTWLCSDYAAPVARGAPVEQVLPWRHKGRSPGAFAARRRARAQLAAGGPYDLLLGLEDKPWGRRLARELGCRHWHSQSTWGEHVVERKAGVLVPLGLWDPEALPPPPIRWSPHEPARAAARALLADLPRPWIGLQAGSHAGRSLLAPRRRRDPDPEWLARTGQALAEAAQASLVVHAGLGGAEARAAGRLVRLLQERGLRARLLRGLDLEALGGALAELDALVSANTGPAHLAAAAGVPVVLLEGPSTPATRPWGAPAVRVLNLGLSCSPCRGSAHGRACFVPRCLDEQEPAAVARAVGELLAERGPP